MAHIAGDFFLVPHNFYKFNAIIILYKPQQVGCGKYAYMGKPGLNHQTEGRTVCGSVHTP
jgi:hypothetical protein